MSKTTITINGRTYDAITGMPVVAGTAKTAHVAAGAVPSAHKAPASKSGAAFSDVAVSKPSAKKSVQSVAEPAKQTPKPRTAQSVSHQAVHQHPQKSHTLYRKALKKPAAAPAQQSPLISRFGSVKPAAQPKEPPHEPSEHQLQPATTHPTVAKVLHNQAAAHAAATKPQPTGKELKELLIKERLAEVEAAAPAKKQKKGNWLSRQPRMVTILSSSLAILILGGYLTYITLPSISLRVAASRAGVNASMPEYKPDGYSLNGPITYSPGEVVISYKSNTNETGYKLIQKATNWDSQAVLDNYVTKLTDNYLTFQERGITIYTFNNKAAWVNGGLLYTIDGDAALSSDQILRVATSL